MNENFTNGLSFSAILSQAENSQRDSSLTVFDIIYNMYFMFYKDACGNIIVYEKNIISDGGAWCLLTKNLQQLIHHKYKIICSNDSLVYKCIDFVLKNSSETDIIRKIIDDVNYQNLILQILDENYIDTDGI